MIKWRKRASKKFDEKSEELPAKEPLVNLTEIPDPSMRVKEQLQNAGLKKLLGVFLKDYSKLENQFESWKKTTEYEKFIIQFDKFCGESKLDDFLKNYKRKLGSLSIALFLQFTDTALKLQKKYNLDIILYVVHEELFFKLENMRPWSRFFKLQAKTGGNTFIASKKKIKKRLSKYTRKGKPVLNRAVYMPIIEVKDTSRSNNLLSQLSKTLNEYFPTAIAYEASGKKKLLLLSIPHNSNFKTVVNDFSKQISRIHREFLKPSRGRGKTKGEKQPLFDVVFSDVRKTKTRYSVDKGLQTAAKILDEKYGITLKWTTLKREYYPEWRKRGGKQ